MLHIAEFSEYQCNINSGQQGVYDNVEGWGGCSGAGEGSSGGEE